MFTTQDVKGSFRMGFVRLTRISCDLFAGCSYNDSGRDGLNNDTVLNTGWHPGAVFGIREWTRQPRVSLPSRVRIFNLIEPHMQTAVADSIGRWGRTIRLLFGCDLG